MREPPNELPRVKWRKPLRLSFSGGGFLNGGEFMGVRFTMSAFSYTAGASIRVKFLSGPKKDTSYHANGCHGGLREAVRQHVAESLKLRIWLMLDDAGLL